MLHSTEILCASAKIELTSRNLCQADCCWLIEVTGKNQVSAILK